MHLGLKPTAPIMQNQCWQQFLVMLKWIKNSKSKRVSGKSNKSTGYKGITVNISGKYEAKVHVKIKDNWGILYVGIYNTLEEAKKARVNYIISLL